MTCKVSVSIDGGDATIEIGPVVITIPSRQLDEFRTMAHGGQIDLVFKSDILERRYVESIAIDDVPYTAADIRHMLTVLAEHGRKPKEMPCV